MRILIEGENLEHYLAKLHEAFRTGLRRTFDAKCYGEGYEGYNPALKSYQEIVSKMFPDALPDLIIVSFKTEEDQLNCRFRYTGLEELGVPVVAIVADYWRFSEKKVKFTRNLEKSCVRFLLSYFYQPLEIWQDTPISDRFIYMPPCFDPALFKDWGMAKVYDVGFLADGMLKPSDFYNDRYVIHQKLLKKTDIRYLWSDQHPGWQMHENPHPLVGENFSKTINSCKIFVTTGSKLHNAQPKIFEALASKVLLMSDEPVGAGLIGLRDGINYVRITPNDVISKIDYYLARPDLCDQIAEEGYQLAIRRHSCYARASDFYTELLPKLNNRVSAFHGEAMRQQQRMEIDLPLTLLRDNNHQESIVLPKDFKSLPISSSPQFSLYRLLRHLRPEHVLEIGSQTGASAVIMALAFRDNGIDADITCIDPFYPSGDNDGLETLKEWYGNVYSSGFKDGIQLMLTTSSQILPALDKKFDFVFVDGSHEYEFVKEDCLMSLQMLKIGGYFMVHDYIIYESVRKACDEVITEFSLPFYVNEIQQNYRGDTCGWVIIRKLADIDMSKYICDIKNRARQRANNSIENFDETSLKQRLMIIEKKYFLARFLFRIIEIMKREFVKYIESRR